MYEGKDTTMMTEQKQKYLSELLRSMRMSGMAEELLRQGRTPEAARMGADERIELLICAEYNLRNSRKYRKLSDSAHLRWSHAELDSIPQEDVAVRSGLEAFRDGAWLDEGRNLLLTGPTGSGKTYAACALGNAALRQLRSVAYYKCSILLSEITRARQVGRLAEKLDEIENIDLLIVDDFGAIAMDADESWQILSLIESREDRKATILISQRSVDAWYDLFAEEMFAESFLDRITHKAYRLKMSGESRRRMNKETQD